LKKKLIKSSPVWFVINHIRDRKVAGQAEVQVSGSNPAHVSIIATISVMNMAENPGS
jgi:hypothetical protein